MTKAQMEVARRRTRGNLTVLSEHRKIFTIGWCAAFVQWGRVHVVQRAVMR